MSGKNSLCRDDENVICCANVNHCHFRVKKTTEGAT